MKTLLAFMCSAAFVTPGSAQTSTGTSAPATETSSAKSSYDKSATKKTEPAKKEEPKMEGVVVSRGEKGFMGVEIVGSSFKITFYDTKKKPIAPDVLRAVLRWNPKYKVGDEQLVLNRSGDGKSLGAPKAIRPPYNFKLFITLIRETSEAADPTNETHVIDFRA